MPEQNQAKTIDFTVDLDSLYQEEAFTDFKVASIRRMTPITRDGEEDPDRDVLFFGHTSLMTQNGPIQLQSPLDAGTLEEAVEVFPEAMQQALQDTIEKMNNKQPPKKGQ